jgi:hypothetical protein
MLKTLLLDLELVKVLEFNNILRCWKCNIVGHIAAHCHTMRCYNYSGFGHKSQDF